MISREGGRTGVFFFWEIAAEAKRGVPKGLQGLRNSRQTPHIVPSPHRELLGPTGPVTCKTAFPQWLSMDLGGIPGRAAGDLVRVALLALKPSAGNNCFQYFLRFPESHTILWPDLPAALGSRTQQMHVPSLFPSISGAAKHILFAIRC